MTCEELEDVFGPDPSNPCVGNGHPDEDDEDEYPVPGEPPLDDDDEYPLPGPLPDPDDEEPPFPDPDDEGPPFPDPDDEEPPFPDPDDEEPPFPDPDDEEPPFDWPIPQDPGEESFWEKYMWLILGIAALLFVAVVSWTFMGGKEEKEGKEVSKETEVDI